MAAPEEWIEQQANLLLRRITLGLDLATAPLIAAGLQVYWTQLVLQIVDVHGDKVFGHTDPGTLCPCCGSAPTGSVTRVGAEEAGFRYLACSLCSAQWHYVRIKCAHCESTKGIHFEELVAQPGTELPATGARPGAVKAECCDTCHHYMKQFVMEKDLEVEAAADDLASLTLDMLVTEAGYERSGHNLMLLFGDPESDDDGGGG
jgi:FdhE protein